MKQPITHEHVCRIHRAFKEVRFLDFGQKTFRHLGRDVTRVRAAWKSFQTNPVEFLANSPEKVSREVLALCE